MNAKYYTTPNGLNLLTEWGGENHDPEIYAANEARARAAVYRFRNRGGLIFGGSRMPRTNAEFFHNMPYTSSGNFAAAYAYQEEAANRAQTYEETREAGERFARLARRFGLVREFRENGII